MKRLLLFIMAVSSLLFFVVSCRPAETITETAPQETIIQHTLPQAGVELSPEPVRIWTTTRQHHHPLRGGSFQNKAIDQLLYEPLINYEMDGRLVGVLASSFGWSEDGLSLIFELKEGVTFSDGTDLTPRDVVVSLQTHINHQRSTYVDESETGEEESGSGGGMETAEQASESADILTEETLPDEAGAPLSPDVPPDPTADEVDPEVAPQFGSKADVLAAISSISSDEEGRIIVSFSRRLSNAVAFLICPILPAVEASNLYAPMAPGSGIYKLQLESDINYVATPVEEDVGLAIDIRVVENVGEAMKLLQNGELDLLLMDKNQYALYSGRQNLRFQGVPENAYTYLRINVQSGFLAVGEQLEQFMDIISWQQKLLENATSPHWHSVLPVSRSDRRMPFQFNYYEYAGDIPTLPTGEAPIRLLKGPSTFDAELAENLRLLLERFNYQVELITASPDEPQPEAELRLITYPFEGFPDAYEFMMSAESGQYRAVLDAFPEATNVLLAGRELIDTAEERAYSQAERLQYASDMRALTFQLPIIGIGVPSAGIAFSPRVEGQLKTAYNSPYTGLEDLTVWPIP